MTKTAWLPSERADMEQLAQLYQQPMVGRAVNVALIVVIGAVAWALIGRFASRLESVLLRPHEGAPGDGLKRRQALANVVRYAAKALVVVVVLSAVLNQFGIDLGPLLGTAGIAGLVIGFGAQNLLRDFFAGIFVLLESQYGVGDFVAIGGVSGTVERITLRMTQLRDGHGNVHIVPNGEIKVVTNKTRLWGNAVLDVGVGYGEDIDRVMTVMAEVGDELTRDEAWTAALLEPLRVAGVQDLADSAVVIRMSVKTTPEERWSVLRELRRRVKNRFDAEGIEIPFPQIQVHNAGDNSRTAAVGEST